jgi:MFS family permease
MDEQVIADLKTTEEMVAFTLSAYALTVGFCPLAWGPLSDRYGRRVVLLSCLSIFFVAAIIAGFAHAHTRTHTRTHTHTHIPSLCMRRCGS